MLKLKLTAEQTNELTFPVGCLVWYNFPDDDVESPILKQGVVESVTLDYGNLIYTVVYIHDNGKIIDEIVEHDDNSVMSTTNMAYGTNCPVIVDSKYDGIVLLPERSCSTTTTTLEEGGGKGGTKTFHYTVMTYMTGGQSRYEFGVEAHRIKYRKVVPTTTTVAIGEELLVLQDADAIVATPNHATVANGAVQATIIIGQAKKKTVVPSSITVEADNNNKRKCDEMDESSPLTITPPMMRDSSYHNNVAAAHSNAIVARSIEEDLHKHETSKSSSINGNSNVIRDGGGTHRSSEGINSSNFSRDDGGTHRSSEDVNDNKIVMTIPEWIQWNHDYCRQDLFFHLIGSKYDKEGKITVQDIAHETKCKVDVKCPRIGEPQFSITITIWTTRTASFNQYGHDYIQVGGPVNPATCRLSEVEIHDMIRKRMEYKIRKDFNSADNMYNILQQAGVFVHDPTGQWRADGKDEIEVGVHRKLGTHRLIETREKVQELLLDYLDYIDDPGAKGRLSYETALSCTGCHHPVDSTSCAVEWKGPNWSGFISLVELPKCNEGRLFNASTILDEQEGQNIQRLGCSIKIYGDAFGVPLKYCDPYLLVSGGTWQNVDKAVEIVRNAISNHYADQSQSVPPQPPPYHGEGIPQFDMVEEVEPADHKAKRLEAWRKHQKEQQQKDDSEAVTAASATVEQLSPTTQCEQNAVELSIDTTLPINDSPNKYNQDSCRSLMSRDSSSNNSGGGEIVMKVPQWMQSNQQKQKDVFFHLVFDGKVTVPSIARETNCKVHVKCPDGISSKYMDFPISITFTDRTSRYDLQPTLNRLDQAREKVLELLLSFLDVKDDMGAKGRLTFDVLSSYDGPHLPIDSTSNAVEWRSPNGALRFLSLIELPPFVHRNGRNDFYSTTILQACESQRMKSLGCLVKGYGDAFGTPLRSCGPYALVSGASWQAVDEAVEMVQALINQHQPPPQVLPLSKGTPHTSENAMLPSQIQPPSNLNSRQVYIPVDEYPTKQLVGLLVGNQGCTRRDLENRFGCRIEVLGKGTEGRKRHRAAGFGPSDIVGPPHALITGDNPASVDAASKQIESMIKERIESDDFVSLTLPLQSPYLSQSTKAISVVRMKLPLWLQQSRKEKEELFFHLVGSKADRPKFDPQRKRSLWDVEFETKCSIKINGFTRRSDTVGPPIVITIGSNESSQLDLDIACEKVMHHLLDYMDFIDDAGAKERVIYEVASSYTGPHCPRDSTSKAVGWKDSNGGLRFLSLIGLTAPFILRDGCNAFHADIQTLEKSDQMNHLSCRIKLYGDVFGVTLKYCNLYVLVSGHSWTNVDKTVEMVRNVIHTNNNRPCRFEPAQSKLLEPTQSQPPAPQKLPPKLEHNDVETPRSNAPLQRLLTNDTACSGASGEIVEDGVEYL